MPDMTTRERFVRTLTGQPVDRAPFIKLFGGTNAVLPHWEAAQPGLASCIDEILQFEGTYRGWNIVPANFGLSQCPPDEVVEDTEAYTIYRGGDEAVHKRVKHGDYHRQTLRWAVETRADWERIRDRHLQADDPSRLPENWLALVEEYRTRDYALQLTHGGVYGFARNLMGDVNLAYAFYDDPELVHEIMDSYTDMLLVLWEGMAREVEFDLVEFWEDMASKNGSIVSPAIFNEFMAPNYRKVRDFARAHHIPILLVDSDGATGELAKWMAACGVTAMYPFEVGAGNDCQATRAALPELGILGGLEKDAMAQGPEAVEREMEKARRLIEMGRCIPGPDHVALSNVSWPQYRYFMERLREVVMTTRPGN